MLINIKQFCDCYYYCHTNHFESITSLDGHLHRSMFDFIVQLSQEVFMTYVIFSYRLTPSYGFVIAFAMYILPLVGKGPMWSTIMKDTFSHTCHKYWWTNIIYINNFYPTKMADEVISMPF